MSRRSLLPLPLPSMPDREEILDWSTPAEALDRFLSSTLQSGVATTGLMRPLPVLPEYLPAGSGIEPSVGSGATATTVEYEEAFYARAGGDRAELALTEAYLR